MGVQYSQEAASTGSIVEVFAQAKASAGVGDERRHRGGSQRGRPNPHKRCERILDGLMLTSQSRLAIISSVTGVFSRY